MTPGKKKKRFLAAPFHAFLSFTGLVLAGLCCSPDSHLLSLACSRPVYRVKVQLHSLDFVFCFNHPLRTEEDRLFYPAGEPQQAYVARQLLQFLSPYSAFLPHFAPFSRYVCYAPSAGADT